MVDKNDQSDTGRVSNGQPRSHVAPVSAGSGVAAAAAADGDDDGRWQLQPHAKVTKIARKQQRRNGWRRCNDFSRRWARAEMGTTTASSAQIQRDGAAEGRRHVPAASDKEGG
ncbi:hypothetical protein [Oryza sativa Japonica Group]|uniref:Uncharacterized protein n=2 Tax=Oryza sativa subsp. japonica TaxID=39947 RepID=Q5SN18_ORYSJ|nr:hypothetical protein [Oryza sativa Japonica Group]BAD72479.1 hypothetical protein [Oryza sativa Japonica Group]